MAIRCLWPPENAGGVAGERVGGQADESHQLPAARLRRLAAGKSVGRQQLAQHGPDPKARVERAVRILEDELHRPSLLGRAPAVHDRATQGDRPGIGRLQADEAAGDGRLARAGLADHAEHLRRPHRQGDVVDGDQPVAVVRRERDAELLGVKDDLAA